MNKDEFASKYEIFYTNDEPILYNDFKIYPIIIKDFLLFEYSKVSIMLPKNKVSDLKVLEMTYLEYLIYMMHKNNTLEEFNTSEYIRQSFYSLISLTLKAEEIKYEKDVKNRDIIKIRIKGDGWKTINGKAFDDIKDIILFQNLPNYTNDYMSPEIEAEINEVNKLKNIGIENPTIEKQKICVVINTAYSLEEINNITIRKFIMLLEQIDVQLHYEIYKQGEMSGAVEFKTPLSHYLYSKKKNKLEDAFSSYKQFKTKMNSVTK